MSGFCPGCNSSECRGEAFHRISPAQLREAIIVLRDRLDAALKRIEELGRVLPTRPENVWKNDPALTVTHVDTERGVVTLERKP